MRAPTRLAYWTAGLLLPFAAAAAHAPMAAAAPAEAYVSASGSDQNPCSFSRPCKTITHAVSVATQGATVRVGSGHYAESVSVTTKQIDLEGNGAVIDATGWNNGVLLQGASASGSKVRGFTIENATQEGILARLVSGVTIEQNQVENNDKGIFLPAAQQTGECAAMGLTPGDCGEGLHLWSVTASLVQQNLIHDNAGGILLTDESGPTNGNTIMNNDVSHNQYDCGITIAGHNPNAMSASGPVPSVGGIFGNTVTGNIANDNGVKGQGAGILLAGGPPGTAVYNNVISRNVASGNGLAGITLHSHAPGQDLNGNVFRENLLGTNNVDGDTDFAVADSNTTGIIVANAVPGTLTSITIENNVIANDHFGIWTLNAPAISAAANHFVNVQVPIIQQP
jgi:parallel beta-helix repeat protein